MECRLDSSEASPGHFPQGSESLSLPRSWEACKAKLSQDRVSGSEEEVCLRKLSSWEEMEESWNIRGLTQNSNTKLILIKGVSRK